MIFHRLCRLLRPTRLVSYSCRKSSSSSIVVESDRQAGIATMVLQKKPVNSMDVEFLTELSRTLEKLENAENLQGLIITSNIPHVFSAGLDLRQMYQPEPEQLAQLCRALQELWIKLYGSKLATVAAISGHSPAGGCLLAMMCDYRIMAPNYTIGISASRHGLIPPFWVKDTFINTCGFREAEKALQLGSLYTTDEALKVGLIDEVVPVDSVVSAASEQLQKWIAIPAHARQLSKMALRKATIDNLIARREEDVTEFVKYIRTDSVQKRLGMFLETMKKKQMKRT